MTFFENRIPPPLVALLFAGAMWGLASSTPSLDIPRNAAYMIAGSLALLGFVTMLAGALSFRRAKTTINPLKPETASTLVTSGVYRYTRNPMYLGMLLVLIAWAVALSSMAAFIGVVAFWLYIGRFQIRPEERALMAVFGSAFAAYRSNVRRWL
ncbi:MAG TPA: isoprenylcysteine carboxylmethyltransferase family protein [Verrucomicrobiae bacterium]|nr:isoprenylcysteine carboxylmethyltransferase family protein [Verrucomicrobiae bacterium]